MHLLIERIDPSTPTLAQSRHEPVGVERRYVRLAARGEDDGCYYVFVHSEVFCKVPCRITGINVKSIVKLDSFDNDMGQEIAYGILTAALKKQ